MKFLEHLSNCLNVYNDYARFMRGYNSDVFCLFFFLLLFFIFIFLFFLFFFFFFGGGGSFVLLLLFFFFFFFFFFLVFFGRGGVLIRGKRIQRLLEVDKNRPPSKTQFKWRFAGEPIMAH